jgi:hypothetical protein
LALPDPVPVNAGVATACLHIPAGTVDILAVRTGPVTAEVNAAGRIVRDGVEAPFTSVKPVFVVVPYDAVPTPHLTLTRAGEGGAASTRETATVIVQGVQSAVLNRYASEPMRARIVEASSDGDPWIRPQDRRRRSRCAGRGAPTPCCRRQRPQYQTVCVCGPGAAPERIQHDR